MDKITKTGDGVLDNGKVVLQANPLKILLMIIAFIAAGSMLQFVLKVIFSTVIGAESFRNQMFKMCGAVWHGKMQYIDWFFRPDYECDSYKFNLIAVHGFLLLNITIAYIIMKFVSNLLFKEQEHEYFRWINNKRILFNAIAFDVAVVFLIAAIRTYVIGFSPKDNVWTLDAIIITIVHFISVAVISSAYTGKTLEKTETT